MAYWVDSAPANIALIKYMGKEEGNMPVNISLSYTIERFSTTVELDDAAEYDYLEDDLGLTREQRDRFLVHLRYIKSRMDFGGYFRVRSSNNFPHGAGIASSASSFAALTKVACKAIADIESRPMLSSRELSEIARHGSGSAARSLFGPWCIFDRGEARSVEFPYTIIHELILIDGARKKISSSEAHKLVRSSLLFSNRVERAHVRCQRLIDSLTSQNWHDAYQICWGEFWDMHALFETSTPHFGYIGGNTMHVLRRLEEFWLQHKDGPIVTLDAGPNIHLLWRDDDLRKLFRASASDLTFI